MLGRAWPALSAGTHTAAAVDAPTSEAAPLAWQSRCNSPRRKWVPLPWRCCRPGHAPAACPACCDAQTRRSRASGAPETGLLPGACRGPEPEPNSRDGRRASSSAFSFSKPARRCCAPICSAESFARAASAAVRAAASAARRPAASSSAPCRPSAAAWREGLPACQGQTLPTSASSDVTRTTAYLC